MCVPEWMDEVENTYISQGKEREDHINQTRNTLIYFNNVGIFKAISTYWIWNKDSSIMNKTKKKNDSQITRKLFIYVCTRFIVIEVWTEKHVLFYANHFFNFEFLFLHVRVETTTHVYMYFSTDIDTNPCILCVNQFQGGVMDNVWDWVISEPSLNSR